MRSLRSFFAVAVFLFIVFGFSPNFASALSGTFTANETVANGVATAQVVTFTPASVSTGETFRLTLNGTNYNYTAVSTSTVATIVSNLATIANVDSAVTCVDTGSTLITCTARVAGVAFTYAASVLDITPPVITVIGSNPLTIAHGSSYTDAGATASDVIDITDPVVTSGSVNTATVGSYTLTYVTHDAANNYATSTRTVNVTDQTILVIAAHSNMTSEATSANGAPVTFIVTTSDNVDSAGTATCSPVSGSTFALGTTTVTCNATDTAGNAAAATTFSVFVQDTAAPAITLSGSNPMSVFQDSTFTDPGATTTDAVSGSTALTTSGSVNTSVVGAYTLTYVTHDTANNYATSTRTVNVTLISLVLTTAVNGDGTLSATTSSATTASTTSSGVVVTLTIPSGTVFTGVSTWNGRVIMPVATTTYTLTATSGYTASSTSMTEMGAGDISLSLDQTAQIVFTGQAGKLVGWSQSSTFHQITSTCNSTTTPTLSSGADCKIDSGSDLMVWTRHMTTFILYTETLIPVVVVTSSSSSSGGGGGGTSSSATPAAVVTNSTTSTSTPSTSAPTTIAAGTVSTNTSVGQVLGTQTYFFTKNLAPGSENTEVAELQKFLIQNKFYTGPVTGYFGPLTQTAVIKFQKARGIDPVGIVGQQTRTALNSSAVATNKTTSPNSVVDSKKVLGAETYFFTKSLVIGSENSEVISLQQFLTSKSFYTGSITGYFGPLTQSAVIEFQKAYNLDPVGIVGPQTRIVLNGGTVVANKKTVSAPVPTESKILKPVKSEKTMAVPSKKEATSGKVLGTSVYTFTKDLEIDSEGSEVIALQLFLMDNKLYTGQITGHFGSLTKVAVVLFQKSRNLTLTGVVDAPTRAELHKGM